MASHSHAKLTEISTTFQSYLKQFGDEDAALGKTAKLFGIQPNIVAKYKDFALPADDSISHNRHQSAVNLPPAFNGGVLSRG